MSYQIKVNTRQIERYLQKMPKQIPFAISTALNATAKDVRTHIVKRVWPRSVKPKARAFAARAFRTKFSNKRDLLSAVFADPSRVSPEGIEAIRRVERGETHYPFRGRYLAVPSYWALTLGTGRLTKQARLALADRAQGTFIANLKGRGPAIWQRHRKGLRLLFTLKTSVPTPRAFAFGREAERKARDRWQGNIRKSVIRAVKSSRR